MNETSLIYSGDSLRRLADAVANSTQKQGRMHVVLCGWGKPLTSGLVTIESLLQESGSAPYSIRLADIDDDSPDDQSVILIVDQNGWLEGTEAHAELIAKLVSRLEEWTQSGRNLLLWTTPHAWRHVENAVDRKDIAEIVSWWRLLPPEGIEAVLIPEVLHHLFPLIKPLRYFGNFERAKEKLASLNNTIAGLPRVENIDWEKVAYWVFMPWFRLLADVGDRDTFEQGRQDWAHLLEDYKPIQSVVELLEGQLCFQGGSPSAAHDSAERGRIIGKELGNYKQQSTALYLQGLCAAVEGNVENGTILLTRALDMANRHEVNLIMAWSAAALALIHMLEGREDVGVDYADLAWGLFDYWGVWHGIVFLMFVDAVRLHWYGVGERAAPFMDKAGIIIGILRDENSKEALSEGIEIVRKTTSLA
jgi:hypothetical protein